MGKPIFDVTIERKIVNGCVRYEATAKGRGFNPAVYTSGNARSWRDANRRGQLQVTRGEGQDKWEVGRFDYVNFHPHELAEAINSEHDRALYANTEWLKAKRKKLIGKLIEGVIGERLAKVVVFREYDKKICVGGGWERYKYSDRNGKGYNWAKIKQRAEECIDDHEHAERSRIEYEKERAEREIIEAANKAAYGRICEMLNLSCDGYGGNTHQLGGSFNLDFNIPLRETDGVAGGFGLITAVIAFLRENGIEIK